MEHLDVDLEIGTGLGRAYPVVVRSKGGEARLTRHFPSDAGDAGGKLIAEELCPSAEKEQRESVFAASPLARLPHLCYDGLAP